MLKIIFPAFFLAVLVGGVVWWFTKPVGPHKPYAKQTTIMSVMRGATGVQLKDLDPCPAISLHNIQEGDIIVLFTDGEVPLGFTVLDKKDGVTESFHEAAKGESDVSLSALKGKCGLVEVAR